MNDLIESLSKLLNSGQLLEYDERVENLNMTKMMLYLFCQLVELVESEQGQVDTVTGARQKGKKKSKEDDYSWDWDVERNK